MMKHHSSSVEKTWNLVYRCDKKHYQLVATIMTNFTSLIFLYMILITSNWIGF